MNDRSRRTPLESAYDVEAEMLLRLARPGETREAALERLSRLCACCHRVYVAERLTRHVCERCCAHVRCGHCGRDFEPGSGTFALLCPDCWRAVQQLVRTMHELESPEERAELRHQMHLAFEPRFACRWREDGRRSQDGGARSEPARDGG
jgi:hypothetical protein